MALQFQPSFSYPLVKDLGKDLFTILIGLVLLDFPGKYRVERQVVNQPVVLRSINWILLIAGKAELVFHLDENSDC